MKPVVACTVAACAVLVIAQAGAARASEYACFAMPETIRVGAEGFRGSIEITSSPGCIPAFSVSSTADWVLPAIPGPTVMPLTVEPNTSGRERSAAIVFDGVAVATVVQEAMRELRGTPARW